jgi:FAD/FMN-containing dehydrogenase/Fe-S oxidoreductase
MSAALDAVLAELGGRLPEGTLSTDPDLLAGHQVDLTGRFAGTAVALARPRDRDQVAAIVAACAAHGLPLVPQGGNTGMVGGAVPRDGELVLSLARLDALGEVDVAAGQIVAGAGVSLERVQAAARAAGFEFPLDFGARSAATIGGAIATDAGGALALAHGTMRRRVVGLEAVLADGSVIQRMSGLLKDNAGYDLPALLIGSEGTLGVVTEATVRLVPDPAHRRMIALGFTDIVAAGVASPAVLVHRPTACEGLDARLIDVLRSRRGAAAVPDLPRGGAWLFVEVSGDDLAEVDARAAAVAADSALAAVDSRVVTSAAETAALWRIRADGAGLAGRSPAGEPAWPGWEDAAVPPDQLGAYLRDFDELVTSHGLTSAPFGHFGDGCMHVRLDLPLQRPDARKVLRSFMTDAATLVGRYGGSLSGEHGDGRARSELLPHMYDARSIELFGAAKRICDPENLLGPGILVDPAPIDADLRFPAPSTPTTGRLRGLALAWAADDGDFAQSVHRCTGVGKCRADNTGSGGVMCPSYLATKEEKDSTRGRSRALQEMINGSVVQSDWRAPEVHEALDLCLSCKGCLSDCPTGVDMASMKSEVLHQAYAGRRRPISHYTLGRLPQWLRLARRMPRISRIAMRFGDRVSPAKRLGGVDSRRSIPVIAPMSFAQWAAQHDLHPYEAGAAERPVLLWVDTFTDEFTPEIGEAMVEVLRSAGYQPVLPARSTCCGLTLISTGQLDAAKSTLSRLVSTLAPAADEGVPIVGVEPSCTAVLRHDLLELLPRDPGAAKVAAATVTLAELLTRTDGWRAPDLTGTRIVAQPHCHHHAVMSWTADEKLLTSAGAEIVRVGGCCGLAGNFGVEQGHYEVSVAVAENNLLPAVRDAGADDVILADGFSCRTQLRDLADRDALHLAQLLADRTKEEDRWQQS